MVVMADDDDNDDKDAVDSTRVDAGEKTIEEEEEEDDDDRGNDRPRLSWAGPVIATRNEVQDRDSTDVVESR